MKNFHSPLPDQSSSGPWSGRRAEADRQQAKKTRHDRIAVWATEMAGTALDLDPDLEAAGITTILSRIRDL